MAITSIDPCYDRLAERVMTTTLEAMSRGAFDDDVFLITPELCIRESCARMKPSP
jgi:DNA-binding LacI/PurR family transcriptional regulator